MIVFAFEFVTGGGLSGAPVPEELAHEADLMLRSLVTELLAIPGTQVRTTRDPRFPPITGVETLPAIPGEDPFSLYQRGLDGADAAWPTAPETGGALERLARLTLAAGVQLIGCTPEAVRLAASKRATSRRLAAGGLPVVPAFAAGDDPAPSPGQWVVKPDDGAGCEGIRLCDDWPAAARALAADPGLVAQPWIEGMACSLSLVCGAGAAHLVSVNRQVIAVLGGRPRLVGLEVNLEHSERLVLAGLARRLGEVVPGLSGYVGVDLVLGPGGPVLLELNPRLTTSYCALGSALGINVAQMILEASLGRAPAERNIPTGRPVSLRLDPAHA